MLKEEGGEFFFLYLSSVTRLFISKCQSSDVSNAASCSFLQSFVVRTHHPQQQLDKEEIKCKSVHSVVALFISDYPLGFRYILALQYTNKSVVILAL